MEPVRDDPPDKSDPTGRGRRLWLAAAGAIAVGESGWVRALAPPPTILSASTEPRGELPVPAVGSRLALGDVPLLDGTTLGAADRSGKVTVIYWWASWCPFCAEQSPLMESLWREQRLRGLLVLGLSIDRSAEIAAAHLKRKRYTFPSAWLSPALAARLAKPRGLPVTVVVGPDDAVLRAESGQMFDDDVAALAAFLRPG